MSHCTVAVRYPAAVIIPAFTCRLRGVQAPADLSQENVVGSHRCVWAQPCSSDRSRLPGPPLLEDNLHPCIPLTLHGNKAVLHMHGDGTPMAPAQGQDPQHR